MVFLLTPSYPDTVQWLNIKHVKYQWQGDVCTEASSLSALSLKQINSDPSVVEEIKRGMNWRQFCRGNNTRSRVHSFSFETSSSGRRTTSHQGFPFGRMVLQVEYVICNWKCSNRMSGSCRSNVIRVKNYRRDCSSETRCSRMKMRRILLT